MTGLDFMLSQRNPWPTFTTKGAPTEVITEKTFRKERRRLQAEHLWMEVKLSWNVLSGQMYTVAPTGKSREQLNELLFNRAARGSQRNPYEEKAYRGPAHREVQVVGAMPRVDAVLQMPMCATGLGHEMLSACIRGKEGLLVLGLMQKWNIAQSGGKQERALTSFFCLDAAWLNEGRCPGGRPSVS